MNQSNPHGQSLAGEQKARIHRQVVRERPAMGRYSLKREHHTPSGSTQGECRGVWRLPEGEEVLHHPGGSGQPFLPVGEVGVAQRLILPAREGGAHPLDSREVRFVQRTRVVVAWTRHPLPVPPVLTRSMHDERQPVLHVRVFLDLEDGLRIGPIDDIDRIRPVEAQRQLEPLVHRMLDPALGRTPRPPAVGGLREPTHLEGCREDSVEVAALVPHAIVKSVLERNSVVPLHLWSAAFLCVWCVWIQRDCVQAKDQWIDNQIFSPTSIGPFLFGFSVTDDRERRFQQDVKIQPNRPIFDVPGVQAYFVGEV